MNKEYGLLYYDMPSGNINLYYKMKRFIDKTCLPVNLSVYIFDWGLKDTIEYKLKSMGVFNVACISLVKFDNTSNTKLEDLANKQLESIFSALKGRIHKSVSKIQDIEKRKDYLTRTARKVKGYEQLLTIYEFTKRVEPSLNILKKLLSDEWNICIGKVV